LPASNTPAFSQPQISPLAGNDPSWASRWSWSMRSKESPAYYVLR